MVRDHEMITKFNNLELILIKTATNRYDTTEFRAARGEYESLRTGLISDSDLWSKLPQFIKDCITLDDFSGFIRGEFSVPERREYLNDALKPAREFIYNSQNTHDRGPETEPQRLRQGSALLDSSENKDNSSVFLVHGRNESTKEMVARFLEKLGLDVTILHEKPDKGRTIIEKFEDHSSVDYAIVLLTPDDVGALAEEATNLSPRARQNVIFEMGYFVGKIKRGRVCALFKGVEQPSDLRGVLYIPLDNEGAWKFKLVRELKAAELKADWDKATD